LHIQEENFSNKKKPENSEGISGGKNIKENEIRIITEVYL